MSMSCPLSRTLNLPMAGELTQRESLTSPRTENSSVLWICLMPSILGAAPPSFATLDLFNASWSSWDVW